VEQRVAAGDHVFRQATRHAETFIVKQGLVRTYHLSPSGKEITVGYWAAGDMVGGPDFFEEHKHIWSCEAAEDSVLWMIKGQDLYDLTLKIPALSKCVVIALSFKLRWVSLLLQNMGTECARHRLAHLLASLCEMYGDEYEDGMRIRYAFTQEEFANMICTTRQWVNSILGEFQQEGILRIEKRRLIICDLIALQKIVNE
tara:strand:- start:691 stop:1290 length:600 start_codon:yes stop_codon:yes gene_type:complete